ncbi:MAG: presqualene diphosphate synthase HpnD [Chloroflexi bacterium]|nr:presqualene diphosphate synthase HpnD [Chloroflexota bacterium]
MEMVLEEAYSYCRDVTRRSARNFYYAFLTLPRRRRCAIYAVYAFCRLCDDVADESLPLEAKTLRLREIGEALDRTYDGRPDGSVFVALKDAVQRYGIALDDLREIILGVEMDLTRTRYGTFEELRQYCYRVASAVGLVCIQVFGYRDPKARDYAVDLGIAMQLTNILRDLREDAARGRVYIPLEDLGSLQYSEPELIRGVVNDSFRRLMAFEVSRARDYFRRGRQLLPLLPRHSRACPAVLYGLYSRVLDRIEERGYNVFERRVSLSSVEKVYLTAKLWLQCQVPFALRSS